MGTKIQDLQVTKVVDGDTIKVQLGDSKETLRLICVGTSSSTLITMKSSPHFLHWNSLFSTGCLSMYLV